MRKNQLVQLLAVTVFANLCISGQSARQENPEVAMAKCTKSTESCDATNSQGFKQDRPCGQSTRQNDSNTKGAARRVVEGKDNTSENTSCKSAARRSMEAEMLEHPLQG